MKLTEPEKKDPALSEDEREGDPADEVPETLAEKIFGIFHRLLPILFACSVAGVGVVLFFAGPREKAANGETAAESSIEPPEPETSVRRLAYDAADLRRESRLREALVEERGGRVALADLRSLKVVGNLTTEGMDGSFFVMKNQSRQALMRVFFPDRTLSVGRDNETLWKTVRAEGGSTETAEISPEDKILLKALGEIHGPLLKRFFRGTAVIRSVENAEGEDGRVIRVTLFCRKNPGVEEVDLDPTSLALLRWQFKAENGIPSSLTTGITVA